MRPGSPRPTAVEGAVCRDYARSSRLEWLEANGRGGFAMGTVSGSNTRRYHGLLVAALRPPVDRYVLLSRLDEKIIGAGSEAALSTQQYPGALHPDGWRRLAGFRIDPFPTWTWDVGGMRVERSLFLVHGEDTVVVRWRASRPLRLVVEPLLTFRDHHGLARANGSLDLAVRLERREGGGTVRVRPYAGLPELTIHHSSGRFDPKGTWVYQAEYLEELDRGLDYREDLWRVGALELDIGEAGAFLVATLADRVADWAAVDTMEGAERLRRRPSTSDPLLGALEHAADQFLVNRADGSRTLIAGYPWFTDWGRDTMISIPGLLVARGRLREARDVLRGFLGYLDRGLVPNRFDDGGARPEYNTADATLWLFPAAHALLAAGSDQAFLREELYPAALDILHWHRRGTHFGIRIDPADGLLVAGDPGTQLTWMDAKVGDWVVTPRDGKPVEVNALWYNALSLTARWARQLEFSERADRLEAEARGTARSFEGAFWNPHRSFLNDVVRPDGVDDRLRPNQLLAVSLPFPLLGPEKQRSVVRAVASALSTPVGIRTLAPSEPGYQPVYRGGQRERDGAYHQGTIWPWLLGPYFRATLRAYGTEQATIARDWFVKGISRHIGEACLGTVSEVFEAEPPFRPAGAPAQAWSVAEVLQVLEVDLPLTSGASGGADRAVSSQGRSP